jgi:hypothetical protein
MIKKNYGYLKEYLFGSKKGGESLLLDPYGSQKTTISQAYGQKVGKTMDAMEDIGGGTDGIDGLASEDGGGEQGDCELELELCINIINFLKYLCEGQNANCKTVKKFLFDQDKDESTSSKDPLSSKVNFVRLAVILFGSFVKFFNVKTAELGIALLDFLYEVVRGPLLVTQFDCVKSEIFMYCKD